VRAAPLAAEGSNSKQEMRATKMRAACECMAQIPRQSQVSDWPEAGDGGIEDVQALASENSYVIPECKQG
jgi:hypothetical protein